MIFDNDKRFATHYQHLMNMYTPQRFVFSNNGNAFKPNSVTLGKNERNNWVIYLDSTFAEKDMAVEPFKMVYTIIPVNYLSNKDAILYTKLFLNRILIHKEDESFEDFSAEYVGRCNFSEEHKDFITKNPIRYNNMKLGETHPHLYTSPDMFLDAFTSREVMIELNGAVLPYSRQYPHKNQFYFSMQNYFNPRGDQYVIYPFILEDFYRAEKLAKKKKRQDLVVNFRPLYTFSNVHCSGYGIEVLDFSDDQKHALYRMFDGNGDLLYVGISCHAQTRFRQHFDKQPWGKDVRDIKVEFFPNRESLSLAEKLAIKRELPKYNVVHST